jgi:hypothetical protein
MRGPNAKANVVPKFAPLLNIGTAFFISCSGLLITAAHVITDPIDRRYGNAREGDDHVIETQGLAFGVLVPSNPLFQVPGFGFYPFEWSMLMAQPRDVPFSFRGVDVKITYDIAICKVRPRADIIPVRNRRMRGWKQIPVYRVQNSTLVIAGKESYTTIPQCDLFLLFWSQAAKDSTWVNREIEYAGRPCPFAGEG